MDTRTREAIGALYAGAVDRARWRDALGQVARLADAQSCLCFVHDAQTHQVLELQGTGFDTAWLQRYVAHYHRLDLARRVLEGLPHGCMRPMHRHVSDQEVARSEYYQDFYIPSGHRYSCGGIIDIAEHRFILSVHRAPGSRPYDDDTVAALQALLDQLPAVFRVRSLAHAQQRGGHLAWAALQHLPRAVLVVDHRGHVQMLNAAAEALARAADVVRVRAQRLEAVDGPLQRALQAAVSHACQRPAHVSPLPLYARNADGLPCLELQVAPLSDELALPQGPPQPCALVMARRLLAPAGWRALNAPPCDLTQAEFQLMVGLVQGMTPEEYAGQRGVSISTVRTQIRMLLAKTGLRRVSEVVAMFAPMEIVAPSTGLHPAPQPSLVNTATSAIAGEPTLAHVH